MIADSVGSVQFQSRPPPPHLTSVQAEQLLARACENEADNAKRMRMGLEPISQPLPVVTTSTPVDVLAASASAMNGSASGLSTISSSCSNMAGPDKPVNYKTEQLANLLAAAQSQHTLNHDPTRPLSAFSAINGANRHPGLVNSHGISPSNTGVMRNVLVCGGYRPAFPPGSFACMFQPSGPNGTCSTMVSCCL